MQKFILLALLASLTVASEAQAQELPPSWTMYASDSTLPLRASQEDAADQWFANYYWHNSACVRFYYEPAYMTVTHYRDMRYENGAWSPCTNTQPGVIGHYKYGIATPIECTPTSSDGRCFVDRHPATKSNLGAPSCGIPAYGNPILPTTGNKFQADTDFTIPGSPWLSLTRFYNSSPFAHAGAFGVGMRHSLEYDIVGTPDGYDLIRPDGAVLSFDAALEPRPGIRGLLTRVTSPSDEQLGWRYDDEQEQIETYDMQGRVLRIDFRGGGHVAYGYSGDARHSATISDHFGRTLNFGFNAQGLVSNVTTPRGIAFNYEYESGSRLNKVVRPDASYRKYSWMNSPGHTGEMVNIHESDNTQPFASFGYDNRGRAYRTERGAGYEKFVTSFAANGNPTVTLPSGAKVTHGVQNVDGKRLSVATQTTCSGASCGQTTESEFDAEGNLIALTDEAGMRACFAYDSRGLLVKQVSGVASTVSCAQAMATVPVGAVATSIQWHATLRKPLAIANPRRLTTFTYDAAYRLAQMTEVPTSDDSGASGTAAPATGNPRTTTFTYNMFGQLTSVDGPRSDVNDIEHYAYDAAGNLVTATNAVGHVTTFSEYDADGRPGKVQRPGGGLVQTMQYDARGFLSSRSEGGLTTSYAYNGMGRVVRETRPDGNVLSFAYDQAGRVIRITDVHGANLGLQYAPAGDVSELLVRDASANTVARQYRGYDQLGRLSTVTGFDAINATMGVLLRP